MEPIGPESISSDLRQAWHQHEAVDRALLDTLASDDLSLPTPAGGWTIEQQLAHIAAVVVFWSGRLDPSAVAELGGIDEDEPASDAFGGDVAVARRFVEQANAATLEAASGVEDWRGRSHRSATSFLTHMMVHAAHHRAQVLLALKQAGRPLPDDGDVWGPWKGSTES